MKMGYEVGDIVRMKKPHPCGSYEWEILRTGVDFRLKCTKCEHLIMIPRPKFLKSAKKIVSKNGLA